MKVAKEMEERLRSILIRDKVGVKSGFLSALNGDVNRLFSQYFDLSASGEVKVEQNSEGDYDVEYRIKATAIKSFDSTADLKF